MKRNVLFAATLFAAGSLFAADPKDTVTAAAKKLADGGNYSWKQTADRGGGGGGFGGGGPQVSQGKTAAGLTWTQTPGFAFGGGDAPPPTERLSKGTNSVTKNQDGQWQTPEEMAAAMGGGPGGGGPGGGFGGGRGFGGGMFGGGATVLPASTAQDVAGLTKSLTEANGIISGDLTEDGAKAQLSFGRRGGRGGGGGPGGGGFTPPEPTNAKASVKFWVKDGALTKYELKSSGTMSFGGNDMQMDNTTTVEFSDVGATKIDAPADAVKKIGG